MIHSAKFGSIERFFGVLTEHYAGAFPAWLAPVQVVGIPITDEQVPYLTDVALLLQGEGRPGRDRRLRRPDAEEDPHRAASRRSRSCCIAGATDAEAGAVLLPLPRRRRSATASRSPRRSRRSPTGSPPGTTSTPPPTGEQASRG